MQVSDTFIWIKQYGVPNSFWLFGRVLGWWVTFWGRVGVIERIETWDVNGEVIWTVVPQLCFSAYGRDWLFLNLGIPFLELLGFPFWIL